MVWLNSTNKKKIMDNVDETVTNIIDIGVLFSGNVTLLIVVKMIDAS
jgi:hypothetical protein